MFWNIPWAAIPRTGPVFANLATTALSVSKSVIQGSMVVAVGSSVTVQVGRPVTLGVESAPGGVLQGSMGTCVSWPAGLVSLGRTASKRVCVEEHPVTP